MIENAQIKHIAIIMDGNRRWAKEHNLPSASGHKKGVEALRNTVKACNDLGIKYLTVYAFSTENWNRKPDEVNFLMDLVAITLKNDLDEMHKEDVKISFIGDLSKLSKKLQDVTMNAVVKTKNNNGVNLQIALNYGARDELTQALKKIIAAGISSDKICADTIRSFLYTKNIPDPDVLIRTGGEMRVSNFLLWQIAYSEFIVVDTYWPDFNRAELEKCIDIFNHRNRRYGK